jgi:hypothetical protein
MIVSYSSKTLCSHLQKVSSNTEDTGKSSRDTSLGSSTSVRDGSVSGSGVLANNSSAVGVVVTTSAGSNNRAQSARGSSA